jgi:ABC-type Mn2+/Zn2+ transport system permease subunit
MLAMLITPPSAAFLLARRLPAMMGIAVFLGVLSGLVGLYLSFYTSIASGAAIVLVAVGLFVVALGSSSMRRRFASSRARP